MPQQEPPLNRVKDRPGMAGIVERNVAALMERRRKEERQKTWPDAIADAITGFTGSMTFVYIHLAGFGAWIVINLPATPLPKFDPTFVVLAMVASVEAIFLSTFVLISQNRMAALSEKRAELDLQVSLLGEHEITRLVRLVSRMAERMGVEEADDPELQELKQNIQPEKVLDTMEQLDDTMQKAAPPDDHRDDPSA